MTETNSESIVQAETLKELKSSPETPSPSVENKKDTSKPEATPTEYKPGKEIIVPRKIIVYETRVDPTVIRLAAEKVKQQPFTKFGLLKPKLEEIEFVSLEKYYQPFIVINGKYSIDYFRRCTYIVKVDDTVKEVVLLNNKILPQQCAGGSHGTINQIKLEGEERIFNETKAFLVLNSQGQDTPPKSLPSAPSEKNPQEIIEKNGLKQFDENTDIDFLKQRIIKRPSDVSRIVSENFEVPERSIIYAPRYKLTYINTKNAQEKIMEFDGVTSEKIKA
ncbi:MAG TPA: hypothetical protein VLU95_00635 [Candidatus Acidoferrum sp.]|nr:hypothetical protein [Candidatus Acidoferrum sp.]